MILKCREYLMSILKQMEIRGRIYTSMRELEASNAVEYAAILFDGESPQRSTEHRRFNNVRRFKIFDRNISFMVSFGSGKADHTEKLYENFIRLLDKAITDDNDNYVPITVGKVEWLDSKDSILRSELLVQIEISFAAGLYKDQKIIKGPEFEIGSE